DEAGDNPGEHLPDLALVAAHQHGVFERVLRQRPQFGEVLVQHLDLLDAGDGLAFRRAPDREIAGFRVSHEAIHSRDPARLEKIWAYRAPGAGPAVRARRPEPAPRQPEPP